MQTWCNKSHTLHLQLLLYNYPQAFRTLSEYQLYIEYANKLHRGRSPDSRCKDNIFCFAGRFYAFIHRRLLSRHRDLGYCNSKICISCVATHAYLHVVVFCACFLMANGYLQKGPTVIRYNRVFMPILISDLKKSAIAIFELQIHL